MRSIRPLGIALLVLALAFLGAAPAADGPWLPTAGAEEPPAKDGAKKGDGDYTIKAGETLKLKHRLYFHHGDPEAAKVAEKFADYAQ